MGFLRAGGTVPQNPAGGIGGMLWGRLPDPPCRTLNKNPSRHSI